MGINNTNIMLMEITEEIRQEIRERAQDMYEARMQWNIPGDHLSDWLQAEKEVLWCINQDLKEHAKQFPQMVKLNI